MEHALGGTEDRPSDEFCYSLLMLRKPRIHYPSAVYHVILCGNAGQSVFFKDRDRFRLYLFPQESVWCSQCQVGH